MNSRLVTWQLRAFVVVTAVFVTLTAVFYVKIPQQLGVGRYDLSVQLADAGGLYPKSVVAYRGVEVGIVTGIELRQGGGVTAQLQIDNGTQLPSDVIAEVRSGSVIGEQYIDFVPPTGDHLEGVLAAGAVISASRTKLPTTTNALLDSLDGLVRSVPLRDLRTSVRELGKAFAGSSHDALGRLIDDGDSLAQKASSNLPQTTKLIDDTARVLATQRDLSPQIRAYAWSLDSLAAQLKASDGDLRTVLQAGGPTIEQVRSFVAKLGIDLPPMLDEVGQSAHVARIFRRSLEHVLIVLPPAVAMFSAAGQPSERHKRYRRANLYFKMAFPTACTTGFPDKDKMRSPYDLSQAPLPRNSYCKVPTNSPLVVRGARNDPCPNGGRGPSASACGLVFDKVAAERSAFVRGSSGTGMADPRIARLLAPNGPLFLLDPTAGPRQPPSWADQLKELVGR